VIDANLQISILRALTGNAKARASLHRAKEKHLVSMH